ncbi:MAG: endonuclease III, partial [Eubacterium sp.]|nr:endonuclease III [Eubacterium sp.]
HIFEEPAVIVDTHVKRTAKRLALTDETDPVKVEYDLMKEIPEDHWTLINLQLITFGREICSSRSPKCGNCFLKAYCREQK